MLIFYNIKFLKIFNTFSKLNNFNLKVDKTSMDNSKKYLEILERELNPDEKDECKILISEYLNDSSKIKKIDARNVNQLFFIIDYLLEFINNKERVYKEKMSYLVEDNSEFIRILKENEYKMRQLENMFNNDSNNLERIKNLNIKFDYKSVLSSGTANFNKTSIQTEENTRIKNKEKKILDIRISETEDKKIDKTQKIDNKEEKYNPLVYKKSFPTKKA
jgi:hypothetical protein